MPRNKAKKLPKFKCEAQTPKKGRKNEEKSLSKSQQSINRLLHSDFPNLCKIDDTEDCEKPIELKAPGIPVQIAEDCDLSRNFVRLEELVNKMINMKDRIDTKSRTKTMLYMDKLILHDEMEKTRMEGWWKKVSDRKIESEKNSHVLGLLKSVVKEGKKCDSVCWETMQDVANTMQKMEEPTTTSKQEEIVTIKSKRKVSDRGDQLGAKMVDNASETDGNFDEMKYWKKKLSKMETEIRRMRNEDNWTKRNKTIAKWLHKTIAKWLQNNGRMLSLIMQKRNDEEEEDINHEMNLLAKVKEEIEREKKLILRAHNVK